MAKDKYNTTWVRSPDDDARDERIALLVEGAVLTRMVCTELLYREDGHIYGVRVNSAVNVFCRWLQTRGYPSPSHLAYDIKSMVVENNCLDLLEELDDGAIVYQDYQLLLSADYPSEADSDMARLEEHLASYWSKHKSPAVLLR
jgi:hypothetical protein